jgi:hypothetical protein
MTEYEIEGDTLKLTVEGMDRVWSLRSHLAIPLSDITDVRADPERGAGALTGVKVVGSRIPGVLQAGTFVGSEGMVFWDVHRPGHAIVISLEHEHYKQLIIDVADPATAAQEISEAARRARG